MIRVLTVGNALSIRGGISEVEKQIFSIDWKSHDVKMDFIPTYITSNRFFGLMYFFVALIRICFYVLLLKPDIAHIHMSYRGSFFRKRILLKLIGRLSSAKSIVHMHGSEFKAFYDEASLGVKEKIKKFLLAADAVVVLGDRWSDAIRSIQPKTNIVVIPNAVPAASATATFSSPLKLLFVGVLNKRKGVDALLRSIKILAGKFSADEIPKLVIAGDGPEADSLKSLTTELGLDRYVSFYGWIDSSQREELYLSNSVLLLPSHNEGLPMAVLEAGSYGLPVIASDVGDVSSVVMSGKTGYLINPDDEESIALAIEAISVREVYNRCSAGIKDLVLQCFSMAAYEESLLNVYQHVTHGTNGW